MSNQNNRKTTHGAQVLITAKMWRPVRNYFHLGAVENIKIRNLCKNFRSAGTPNHTRRTKPRSTNKNNGHQGHHNNASTEVSKVSSCSHLVKPLKRLWQRVTSRSKDKHFQSIRDSQQPSNSRRSTQYRSSRQVTTTVDVHAIEHVGVPDFPRPLLNHAEPAPQPFHLEYRSTQAYSSAASERPLSAPRYRTTTITSVHISQEGTVLGDSPTSNRVSFSRRSCRARSRRSSTTLVPEPMTQSYYQSSRSAVESLLASATSRSEYERIWAEYERLANVTNRSRNIRIPIPNGWLNTTPRTYTAQRVLPIKTLPLPTTRQHVRSDFVRFATQPLVPPGSWDLRQNTDTAAVQTILRRFERRESNRTLFPRPEQTGTELLDRGEERERSSGNVVEVSDEEEILRRTLRADSAQLDEDTESAEEVSVTSGDDAWLDASEIAVVDEPLR